MIAAFVNQMQTNLPKRQSFQGVFLLWYPDLLRWNLVGNFLDYLWVFFVGLWHFGSVFSAIFWELWGFNWKLYWNKQFSKVFP